MTDFAKLEMQVEATEVARARDHLGRFVKEGKKAEGAALGVEKSVRRLDQGAGALNRTLGGLVTTMISLQGARKVTGILTEMEDGLKGVEKTTGLAGGALLDFRRDIEEMATNSGTLTGQLYEIAESAGQLGIRGADSIGGFTDAIAKLADAAPSLRGNIGNTSLEMGKLLAVTNESADNTFNLASVIARLGDEYATLENKVLGTGLEVAKAGASYGVNAQQALGLAAAFDSIGTEAELSRSAVVTVFGEMTKAIAQGGTELDIFSTLTGQTTGEFAAAFKEDAVGTLEEFVVGLGQFKDQGGELSILLNELGLSSKRLFPTLSTLATNSERLSKTIATAAEEFLLGTKLQNEFRIGSDSLSKSLVRLQNTTSILVNRLSDDSGLGGGMRDLVEGSTDVVRVLAGMDAKVKGNYQSANLFAGGVVGLTAALSAYAAGIGAAAIATAAFASPFSVVALGVGGAVAALYTFRDSAVVVGGEVRTLGDVTAAAFEVAMDRVGLAAKVGAGLVSIGIDGVTAIVRSGFQGVLYELEGFGLPLGISWQNVWDALIGMAYDGTNKLIGIAKAGFGIATDLLSRLVEAGDIYQKIASGNLGFREIKTLGSRASKLLDFDDVAISSAKSIATIADDHLGALGDIGVKGAEAFKEGFQTELRKQSPGTAGLLDELLKGLSPESLARDFQEALQGPSFLGLPFEIMAKNAKLAFLETRNLLSSVSQIGLAIAGFGKLPGAGSTRDRSGVQGLVEGSNEVSLADRVQKDLKGALTDLNFATDIALLSDRSADKEAQLAGITEEIGKLGASAKQQAIFVELFDQKLEQLADLNRIREISNEFAGAFGGAFRSAIKDVDDLEGAIKGLGNSLADIALDRFVIDPFVDGLAAGFGEFGASVTGTGQDPTEGLVASLQKIDAPALTTSSHITRLGLAADAAATTLSSITGSAAFSGAAGAANGATVDSALGNAFYGGRLHYFAQGAGFGRGNGLAGLVGDILNQGPVTFPLGVAGEAGAEAIMPGTQAGGGFSVYGQMGGQRFQVPLMRDPRGSLAVDLESIMVKPKPFKDGAFFGSGGTATLPRVRGSQRSSAGSGDTIHNTHHHTWNIKTRDANSFRDSQRAIEDRASRTFNSPRRRNR